MSECRTCYQERKEARREERTMDGSTARFGKPAMASRASVLCPDCGAEIPATPLLVAFERAGRVYVPPTMASAIQPEPPRDDELEDGLHEAISMWQERALLAERALTDVMDGMKPHDVHDMTGLDDTRCHEIYNVYHRAMHPDKPLPFPETGLGEIEETT